MYAPKPLAGESLDTFVSDIRAEIALQRDTAIKAGFLVNDAEEMATAMLPPSDLRDIASAAWLGARARLRKLHDRVSNHTRLPEGIRATLRFEIMSAMSDTDSFDN
jgi:hypothetical protein